MFRSIATGLGELGTNPLRTVLSTLGVIIGVAALVAILALGDGLEEFARGQIADTTDLQYIAVVPPVTERVDGVLIRRENVRRFSAGDVASLKEVVGENVSVARRMNASSRIAIPDSSRPVAALVILTDQEGGAFERKAMQTGRFLQDSDGTETVVLSAQAAAAFGLTPRSIQLGDREFDVVGVMEGDTEARPLRVYVRATGDNIDWVANDARVPSIGLRVADIEEIESTVERAESWIASRFPGEEDIIRVTSYRARAVQATRALQVFKLAMASIAAISLLVGGIGIMNILLASVSERTREIGIRKATGATNRDIRIQFLAESVAVAGVGCIVGVVVGMLGAIGAAAMIRAITEAPLSAAFTWPSVVGSAVIALFIGLIFGTYPARKASRLSPVEAIRHE